VPPAYGFRLTSVSNHHSISFQGPLKSPRWCQRANCDCCCCCSTSSDSSFGLPHRPITPLKRSPTWDSKFTSSPYGGGPATEDVNSLDERSPLYTHHSRNRTDDASYPNNPNRLWSDHGTDRLYYLKVSKRLLPRRRGSCRTVPLPCVSAETWKKHALRDWGLNSTFL
jgi:hypothetical protein